jgi:hypothetical protein
MPFLNSQTIRPLYDVHDGGPPLGFRCMCHWQPEQKPDDRKAFAIQCYRVTRTLRGMVQHQRMVHGLKQQQEFNFESIAQTAEQDR